ncbi:MULTISPECIES: FtsB family cell division protein [unclassified Rathayibacter]|uniref:FtsB family cell division protein n=1 Tax=unclassified Rathayibacter TaxID=2609250 RepID=UPI00188BFADE|nr:MULTISPECIES: septum formation initiator family protein [unclassified Rathayibacter]MBF4462785.1 septum formation initiator family protein [Rathayibacter sp. VKM Ac-2879]MBF4504199.1 septum formation initiator family protein [Rathayibacter sp. VKM Ac-2878]
MARPPRRPATPGSAPRRPAAPVTPSVAATDGARRGSTKAGTAKAGPSPRASRAASAPKASRPPQPATPAAWLAGVRGSGFTLLVMAIMILAVVILAPSIKNFVEQRAQIAELQRSVDAAKTQSQNLDEQRTRWSDPAYIRAQARERLYFVMPGEVSYLVLDDIAVAQQAAQPASDAVQETPTDWAGALLSSLAVAGLGNPSPSDLTPSFSTPAPPSEPTPGAPVPTP